jgi:hypothetical protein
MAEDLMRYDLLVQEALRRVVRLALLRVARTGLPGDHHFFIAINNRHEGVKLSERLRQKYPNEMTIVLQHQFWNLTVHERHFEVGLSFDNIPEKLSISFDAIKGFFDPSVQFGLQFEEIPADQRETLLEAAPPPASATAEASMAAPEDAGGKPERTPEKIVSLDQFRKK